MRKWGDVPEELEIGQLMSRFNQTPYQLGLCESNDIALLYRALHAVRIDEVARRCATDMEHVSVEDLKLIAPLQKALKK